MLFKASPCNKVPAPTAVSFTNMSTSLIFSLVTVSGNLLVVLVVLIDPNKNFRAPFTMLILNLAVTDLIVGTIVEPLSVWIHYREAMGWSIPIAWLSQTAYFLCCTASLLSLAVLTIDRYLAITSAVWYRANVGFRRVVFASAGIWLASIAFTSIYKVTDFVSYAFIFANIALFCAVFIVIFAYVRIFHSLKVQANNAGNLHAGESEVTRAQQRAQLLEDKLTKTYKLMLFAFLLSYVPSSVMIYLMNLCEACSCVTIHWLRDFQFIFVVSNSMVNPFLYAIRLQNFRRALSAIVKKLPCCSADVNRVGPAPNVDAASRIQGNPTVSVQASRSAGKTT